MSGVTISWSPTNSCAPLLAQETSVIISPPAPPALSIVSCKKRLWRSFSCHQFEGAAAVRGAGSGACLLPGGAWRPMELSQGRVIHRFTDEEVFLANHPGADYSGAGHKRSGQHLVRVRAQVMMREDSTGGWVPLGGGGLSHVAVRKRKIHHEDDPPCKHEYLIYGKRINDQKVVMSCTIKRDFQYNRVMPTFHHWRTGNMKYGLTFQTAADARAFHAAVQQAVDDLLSGLSSPVTPPGSAVGQLNKDVEEDDVFMQLELPLERDSGSGASSPSSPAPALVSQSGGSMSELYPQFDTHQRIAFPGSQAHSNNLQRSRTITGAPSRLRSPKPPGLPSADPGPLGDNIYEWLHKSEKMPLRTKISEEEFQNLDKLKEKVKQSEKDYISLNSDHPRYVKLPGEDSMFGDIYPGDAAYVKLDILPAEPQYHYPNLDMATKPGFSSKSEDALKRNSGSSGYSKLRLPTTKMRKETDKEMKKRLKKEAKKPLGRQERCVHCHELFSETENRLGSCRYSPDLVKQGIDCVSCLACAKCLLYHCHYEDENFTDDDICTCDNTDGQMGKRWLGLSLLAVLVPCLCLYPLLTACHTCGRACRMCGGRHVAS